MNLHALPYNQLRRFGITALVLLVAISPAGTTETVSAAEKNEKNIVWYPKSLEEIKGVLTTLALPSGHGSVQDRYLQRLKMYRYICDLPYEDLVWSEELEEYAHQAVVAFTMNNEASHGPKKPPQMSDEDYRKAQRGAGGNLFAGLTEPAACVDGWIYDSQYGPFNALGHRRWCLNPSMVQTAFATKAQFAVMQFDGSRRVVPDWDYVAFPARGYMPIELNYMGGATAWSVSLNMSKYETPNVDLVQVTIQPVNEKMVNIGEPLPLDCFTIENQGFGSGTAIIFRPEAFTSNAFKMKPDTRYRVTINGLRTREQKNQPAKIEYLVHFIDLQKVSHSADSQRIVTATLRKQLSAIESLTNTVDQWEALNTFLSGDMIRAADPSLTKDVVNELAKLDKDPVVQKEQEAERKYQVITGWEKKAAGNKPKTFAAANTYWEFSQAFKGTRASRKAAVDFERLKQKLIDTHGN
jgi:hypothetical protein